MAISEAVTRLGQLDSYRFVTRADNRIPVQPAEGLPAAYVFRGLSRRSDPPSLAGSLGMAFGEGPTSGDRIYGGFPVVVTGGRAWFWGKTSLEEMPLDKAMEVIAPFEPAAVLRNLVSPFASGFEWIGTDSHAGVAADHYRATAAGRSSLATALGIDGTVTADLWIAREGGYLVGVSIQGTDAPKPLPSGAVPAEVVIRLDITAANDPLNVISPPAS